MKLTKLTTMRVDIDDTLYCIAIPSETDKKYHDFYLCKRGYAPMVYMFGIGFSTEEQALELIEYNTPMYIDELNEAINEG